jgi:hypothetical protein
MRSFWFITGHTGLVISMVSSVPAVARCPHISGSERISARVRGIVTVNAGKTYVRVGANDPDGSCGGAVSQRNLKGVVSARSTEVSTIPRQVDLRVHDDVALDEIELYGEVLTAVAASDGPLTPTELDAALGVSRVCCSLRIVTNLTGAGT